MADIPTNSSEEGLPACCWPPVRLHRLCSTSVGVASHNVVVDSSLEIAINALSAPQVAPADALRTLYVVARRMRADDLTAWLYAELNGYSADAGVPEYRSAKSLPIQLHFDGPMQSWQKMSVSPGDLPDALSTSLTDYSLRDPIAELEGLCAGERDPQMALPMMWVEMYRHFIGENRVPRPEMMVLNKAALVIPSTYLRGKIDRIKTAALELAMSLEHVSPKAGSAGGPQVRDNPKLAETVNLYMTQIYGEGATLAVGPEANAVKIEVGDVEGVLRAAERLLAPDAIDELRRALTEDGDEPGGNTHRFLQRVKDGGVILAGGVASTGAYEGLVVLFHQAFPGFLG